MSDHATCVRTGDSTGWEFGTPVTYQVTAEDGTSQLYTVTAVQADVTESCEMTSFKIGNSEGVIDQTAGDSNGNSPCRHESFYCNSGD